MARVIQAGLCDFTAIADDETAIFAHLPFFNRLALAA
jgi:hypothetical protein